MIKAGTQENLAFRLFCFSYKLRKIPPFREILRQSLRMTQTKYVMLSVSETSPGKAKPSDLMLSVIFNPKNTTLPGVCSPVEAGEHTRRLEYERQYSRSDLYCGDSSLRSE